MDPQIVMQLAAFLNTALTMEIAAAAQYGSHTAVVTGLGSQPVIEQLLDSEHDEQSHADKLRELLGDYLKVTPVAMMATTRPAEDMRSVLIVNIDTEGQAIEQYQKTLDWMADNKAALRPVYERFEHDIRMILAEEQQHVAELEKFL